MSKYKPQHNRLLFIDRKVSEGHFPNCKSLAAEWEVSSKTIQRDLDYMRYQLDAPLEYSAKHRGYRYTEKNFHLPAISVKESDIFAIYLAEELLEQYRGTPFYDNLSSVFQKIEDSLPDKTILNSSQENSKFTVFPAPSATTSPDVWNAVFSGLQKQKKIKITYQSPGQQTKNRVINSYHAVRYDGEWYVTGLCNDKNETRTFCLSRIKCAEVLNEEYEIPSDFDFKKITHSRFGLHWGGPDQEVKIKFSQKAKPYILEKKWHPSQHIKETDDGNILLTMTVGHTLELKRWVLSWGKEAVILEPEWFKIELKSEIHIMNTAYKECE